MKTLLLICAAVVALAFAGAGGSVVGDTIITIAPKRFARLAGTDVYCKNVLSEVVSSRSFECARRKPNGKWKHASAVEVFGSGIYASYFQGPSDSSFSGRRFPAPRFNTPGCCPDNGSNVMTAANTTLVKPGQWARLGTTSVYCQAYIERGTHQPGFDCGDWVGNNHLGGSYSAIIDEQGVEVDRWDASGRHVHRVVTYLNR
jgi:hypothetical protein